MKNNHGFIKAAAAVPRVRVADCEWNARHTLDLMRGANDVDVQLLVFSELGLTGYTCADLFHNSLLIEKAEEWLAWLLKESAKIDIVTVVGLPVRAQNRLFNCAVAFKNGKILGIVPKTYLPNYNEFYENRWFASAADSTENSVTLCRQTVPFEANLLFRSGDATFAIELCEDLWAPIPPSCAHALAGADIIVNLSASNELTGKNAYLKNLIRQQSARCIAGYVYASAGFGESSTDLVFAGNAIVAENGSILAENSRFSLMEQLTISEIDVESLRHDRQNKTAFSRNLAALPEHHFIDFEMTQVPLSLTRVVDATPFIPKNDDMAATCDEILNIQTHGLATRLATTGIKQMVLGISGGLDSALALLVCVRACDLLKLPRTNVVAITMPGFGTTGRTYKNATELVQNLGATLREISIEKACLQHFADIGHDATQHDTTYENTQARERTQILMDVANQCGGLVIGTGDLSELALGWATYNGDHMSMYAVNTSIPKTLVRYLVRHAANSDFAAAARNNLLDIIDTPVSPELLPADAQGDIAQKTEDLVGPYELHDFFLYNMLRHGFSPSKILLLAKQAFADKFDDATIQKWLRVFVRRFFNQQFKRSCMPDGPKVGSVNLSPRGDWRMPSDASSAMWQNEVN